MSSQREVQWTREAVARFWDYQSKRPSIANIYFSALHGAELVNRTRRWLPAPPGKVLDMGCGTGAFLRMLATACRGMPLAGVDFSEDSVRTAKETCAAVRPLPDLRAITSYPTPWPPQAFDVIYCLEVVEHLDDEMLDGVLGECARLLKARGVLIVTTPHAENLERQHTCCPDCGATFHIWQHQRSWSVASLTERIQHHGFVAVKVHATFLEPLRVRIALWIARKTGISKRQPQNLIGVFRRVETHPAAIPA